MPNKYEVDKNAGFTFVLYLNITKKKKKFWDPMLIVLHFIFNTHGKKFSAKNSTLTIQIWHIWLQHDTW